MADDRYYIGPNLLGRIRRTIRRVDMMPGAESGAGGGPVHQELQQPARRGLEGGIRICTFTGTWLKSQAKTLTFKYTTTTPNTVVATNLFCNISVDCGTRDCAIGREGSSWYLLSAEC